MSDLMKDILTFLWKWKFSTTAALHAKFFPNISRHGAYKRLRRFAKYGVIGAFADREGKKFFWTLTKTGFADLKVHLPQLETNGFRSECPEHDHLVSSFHLGDWLLEMPEGADLFTEQQLRHYPSDFYPDWLTHSRVHRSDGYWCLNAQQNPQIIALEVELTAKKNDEYFLIGDFYDSFPKLHRVIWLIPNDTFARMILRNLKKSKPRNINAHLFVRVPDFEMLGWDAAFILDAIRPGTVREILSIPSAIRPDQFPGRTLLDARKSHGKTDTYHLLTRHQKS